MYVPSAADDRPAWGRVAALAIVGFAVGIAWPRLAGVRMGPSAPSDIVPAAASAAPPDHSAASASSAAVPASLTAPVASPAASGIVPPVPGVGAGAPSVTVQKGQVLSCRGADGENHKGAAACGDLSALDAILQPRIRRLSSCAAADSQVGKLAVVLGVDFQSNKLNANFGHSSSMQNLDSLGSCLRLQLDSVSLGAVAHDQPRYTVLYNATFSTRDPSAGKEVPVAPASDGAEPSAQVVWDVAIVRDLPRTGTVIARLQRGTRIHVSSGQDGWYRVKYGDGFSSEGWVYRGAIGK